MAGRPQTMLVIAEATGRTGINPARYQGRNVVMNDNSLDDYGHPMKLGPPPPYLTVEEAAAWRHLSASAWWLEEPDRHILEACCRVMARTWKPDCAPAWFNTLDRYLSKMGFVPATRNRVLQERGLLEGGVKNDDDDV